MRHGVVTNGTLRKHEDEKNMLRMGGGSWTINLDDINNKNIFVIKYITKSNTYIINIDKAIKNGFERFLGGERKLVVPLEFWTILNK